MAEITYRIPSKAVQYGYVEVTRNWSDDEPTDPEMLAAAYINYVYAFQKEEQAAISRLKDAPQKPSAAPQGAEQSEVDRAIGETLKAAQVLADGLGGVTKVGEEDVHPEESDPEETGKAPWDAKVKAKAKPWQTDGW